MSFFSSFFFFLFSVSLKLASATTPRRWIQVSYRDVLVGLGRDSSGAELLLDS